jgi:uncharacterized protein (TIGR02271 family)
MAKTLVALYHTMPEAEQVVQDLAQHGFAHSDIRLMTHNGAGRPSTAPHAEHVAVGDDLREELTELGVPENEARTYAEGVRQGEALVVVHASDTEAERGVEIMNRRRRAEVHAPTAQAPPPAARRREQGQQGADKETTIPVVEEEITVGTRQVERGTARIHTRVTEHPVEETVRLREEHVTVERHPVNRPATAADLEAGKERTIEVTETVEEPVVSKSARVVEEVTVHKEAQERTETVRDTVRRQDVEVEQGATAQTRDVQGFETYAAAFRRHHSTAFASSGTAYEAYEPAYRYGYELSTNERYRGRDWTTLEADARRDWETRQPGTWARFHDAIRHAWEAVRGRR